MTGADIVYILLGIFGIIMGWKPIREFMKTGEDIATTTHIKARKNLAKEAIQAKSQGEWLTNEEIETLFNGKGK